MAINTYVPIITLTVSRLNAPFKETEWQTGLKKKKAYNMLPVETHRRAEGTQIENEGIEKDISCKWK